MKNKHKLHEKIGKMIEDSFKVYKIRLDEVCRFMNYETVEQWYKNLESIQKIKEGF